MQPPAVPEIFHQKKKKKGLAWAETRCFSLLTLPASLKRDRNQLPLFTIQMQKYAARCIIS